MKNIIKNLLAVMVITTSVAQASESVVSTISNNALSAGKNSATKATEVLKEAQELVDLTHPNAKLRRNHHDSRMHMVTWRLFYNANDAAYQVGDAANVVANEQNVRDKLATDFLLGMVCPACIDQVKAQIKQACNYAISQLEANHEPVKLLLCSSELRNRLATEFLSGVACPVCIDQVRAQIKQDCAYAVSQLEAKRTPLKLLLSNSELTDSTSFVTTALKMVQRVIFPYQKRASELHDQLTAMIDRLNAISALV